MAFAGEVGVDLDLARVGLGATTGKAFDPDSTRLYSQSCSRFLVEVAEGSAAAFQRALSGLPCAEIGKTTSERRLRIRGSAGAVLADVDIEELRRAFRGAFQG
jgi:phosphoribosylformylglycinamidine synthase